MKNESDSTSAEPKDKGSCSCPFCDAPVEKVYPFCKDCGKEVNFCKKCGKPVPPHVRICPDCQE